MQTFKQHLAEVFETPVKWTFEGRRGEIATYTADIDGKALRVQFEVGYSMTELSFSVDQRVDTTGGGDQYKVFATVLDIAKDYDQRFNPEVIMFTGEKKTNKTGLYDRLVKKFSKRFGFSVQTGENDEGKMYLLTRE